MNKQWQISSIRTSSLTFLLVGLLRKSELPKMHEHTAILHSFMYAFSFTSISNPVLENPGGPLINPQCRVLFFAKKDRSLSSSVWCPPNLGSYILLWEGIPSWSMNSSENCVKFMTSLGSTRYSTDSRNPTSQGKSEKSKGMSHTDKLVCKFCIFVQSNEQERQRYHIFICISTKSIKKLKGCDMKHWKYNTSHLHCLRCLLLGGLPTTWNGKISCRAEILILVSLPSTLAAMSNKLHL